MRCQDIKNKLELYFDNELSDQEMAEVEQHLSTCSDCAKEFEVVKSINSLGKVETFSEPEPGYWNQLSQNIIHQIGGPEEKPSWLTERFERLKRILVPEKISFRLVGLAATAVIVFFIVHISFFRQGKFEIPIEIGVEDAIENFGPESLPTTSQKEVELEKELTKEKSVPTIAESTPDKDVDLPKAPESEFTIKIPQPSMRDKNKMLSTSTKQAEMATTEDLPPQKPAVAAFDQAVPVEKKERADKFIMKKTATQLQNLKETRFPVAAMSNRSNYLESDTSLNQYQKVIQYIQSIPDLNEKIDNWEKYLQTNPAIELVKKTKCELALLYYQLVEENPTQENIYQAIRFFSENVQFLFSTPDSLKFKKQFEVLHKLVKKIEKR